MNMVQSIVKKLFALKDWFIKKSLVMKLVVIVLVLGIGWFIYPKIVYKKSSKPQYQTAQVEKGTLIVSVSASGQVSSANSASVSTQTSGVVSKIFVENGQAVKSGDQIAQIDLDMDGKQRSAQALASYQSAKNSLDSAKANLYSLQSTMLGGWQTYMDIAQGGTYQNADGSPKTDERQLTQFMIPNDDWLASEAKYKIQQNVITQTQTSVNSTWASYQQASPIIYAPISGTISGLSLQIGSVLTAQTGSSGNSTSQRIANIKTDATPTVAVNLTQIDAPKVKPDMKATLTLDALPGKTYTGKVVSIDTTGTVSSGVTSYPAVIKLDTGTDDIFPNMSAQANIIAQTKDNVVMIPSSAIQSQNGQTVVRIMKNGKVIEVSVEVGLTNGTQTEIASGISEGDVIVTSVQQSTTNGGQRTNQTQSPFGAFGGGGGGGFRGAGGR